MNSEMLTIDHDVDVDVKSIEGWLGHPVLRRSLLFGYLIYDLVRISITAVPTALVMIAAYKLIPTLLVTSQGIVSIGISSALFVLILDILFPGPYRSVLSAASVEITSIAVKQIIKLENKKGNHERVNPDVVEEFSKDLLDDFPFMKTFIKKDHSDKTARNK